MKDNNNQNNNTSNAIANQALQKKSEGVSLEPPTTKLAFVSAINQPIQKKISKSLPVQMYQPEKEEMAKRVRRKTPEGITEIGGVKMNDNKIVSKQQPFSEELAQADDDTKINKLIEQAEALKPKYDDIIKGLASQCNGTAKLAPVKTFKRAKEKVVADFTDKGTNMSDVSRLVDLCRGSIVFDKIGDIVKAVELLPNSGVKIIKAKNKFSKLDDSGYRDFNFNIEIDGYICELQLHIKEIIEFKDGAGHDLYVEQQGLERATSLTGEQKERLQAIIVEARGRYDAAYKKAGGQIPYK